LTGSTGLRRPRSSLIAHKGGLVGGCGVHRLNPVRPSSTDSLAATPSSAFRVSVVLPKCRKTIVMPGSFPSAITARATSRNGWRLDGTTPCRTGATNCPGFRAVLTVMAIDMEIGSMDCLWGAVAIGGCGDDGPVVLLQNTAQSPGPGTPEQVFDTLQQAGSYRRC